MKTVFYFITMALTLLLVVSTNNKIDQLIKADKPQPYVSSKTAREKTPSIGVYSFLHVEGQDKVFLLLDKAEFERIKALSSRSEREFIVNEKTIKLQ